jgi:hypothetical protein
MLGGILGMVAADLITFLGPGAWRRIACPIVGFITGVAVAAGAEAGIAAFWP